MKFNDIIRTAMKQTGTTQEQLGKMLGIRQTAVSNILHRPKVMIATFVTIMDLLGYDIIVRSRDFPEKEEVLTNE